MANNKYFYVYDLYNNEIVSCYYKTLAEAKKFLAALVQVDVVEEYLATPNCEHVIKETEAPML